MVFIQCLLDLLQLLIQAVSAGQQPLEASNNKVKVLYSQGLSQNSAASQIVWGFSQLYAKTGQVSIFVA
jgi:hypothetical protein